MYGISTPIFEMAFAIGGVGGMWLDVLISMHNRAVHVSNRIRMSSLLHAMGTAGLASFVFFLIEKWSESALRAFSIAWAPGGADTAIGHAIAAAIALALCAACHVLVFWTQLQFRFRLALGISAV